MNLVKLLRWFRQPVFGILRFVLCQVIDAKDHLFLLVFFDVVELSFIFVEHLEVIVRTNEAFQVLTHLIPYVLDNFLGRWPYSFAGCLKLCWIHSPQRTLKEWHGIVVILRLARQKGFSERGLSVSIDRVHI